MSAASIRRISSTDVSGPWRKRGERPRASLAAYPVILSNAGFTKRMCIPGSANGSVSVTITMSLILSTAEAATSGGRVTPKGF